MNDSFAGGETIDTCDRSSVVWGLATHREKQQGSAGKVDKDKRAQGAWQTRPAASFAGARAAGRRGTSLAVPMKGRIVMKCQRLCCCERLPKVAGATVVLARAQRCGGHLPCRDPGCHPLSGAQTAARAGFSIFLTGVGTWSGTGGEGEGQRRVWRADAAQQVPAGGPWGAPGSRPRRARGARAPRAWWRWPRGWTTRGRRRRT